jgi:acetylornithine deacetylase/succinyl-diaminopimelate desuccinylase-like protein
MDNSKTAEFVNEIWDSSIIPEISEYIKVPNKSPAFDPDWERHGHMEQAVQMLEAWAKKQAIADMQVEIVRIEGRTPILFIDIPGASDDVVLLYGHYDKQPEFSGWDDDLDPWTPVIKDGKLYGRGGADDGYATFGSLTAIRALQEQGVPHAHCTRRAACALCGHHRRLRGKWQLRPSLLHRLAWRSYRLTKPGCLPGRGMRQL